MRASFVFAAILGVTIVAAPAAAQTRALKSLQIYVIDVEGGNATLIVSPAGESLLIDTGNPSSGRDAERIVAAARDAGLTQIDHLIITHYHADHIGGLPELLPRFPIRHFIDHGPNIDPMGSGAKLEAAYKEMYARATHTVAKPGARLPITGVDVQVVTSNGEVIAKPLPGAGQPNPYCARFKPGTNNLEDPMSVGVHITFGRFRTIHLGDLTKNKEFELMCPANRLGTVDVILGVHHGQATSNSEVIVHALRPRVIIMNNGTRKGGEPEVMQTIFSSPGLEDLWQIHFSLLSGQEHTVPGMFIANIADDQPAAMPIAPITAPTPGPGTPPPPAHNGPAYWFKLAAEPDGTYTVTNTRNGFSKTYRPGDARESGTR
ncbi:MAG: MBL fold metallo-hydrolase [Acidobacteria bacterium]|nr:MBL fold metallo-hydrolase [Acidobacteriota bacterium]